MTRMQQLAIVATCLLAAMTNAGTVTAFALAAFLLPGVAMAAVVGSFLAARRRFATAVVLGGLLAFGWSELVNIWSGTADGPAARATFVAAGCTLIAVVVAWSRSPAFFLVAVAGSVCGALLLGAGGEVRIVVVAAAVAAALTLGSIERSRRNWTAQPRRGPALVMLSLLVGVVAAGVVLLQAQRDPKQPQTLASGLAYPGIKPPWTDPLGTAANALRPPPPQAIPQLQNSDRLNPRPTTHERTATKPSTATTPHARPSRNAPHRNSTSPFRIWLYVLVGILLVALLALGARFLAVRLAWLRLRRRLAAGAPAQQITGAWAWMRMRLEACRLPLPAAVSPDVVAAGAAGLDLPGEVFVPLRALATSTTSAAFANEQSLGAAEVIAAWTAADRAGASARQLLTRPARVRLAFRRPAPKVRTR
jgi:hypothetical protein